VLDIIKAHLMAALDTKHKSPYHRKHMVPSHARTDQQSATRTFAVGRVPYHAVTLAQTEVGSLRMDFDAILTVEPLPIDYSWATRTLVLPARSLVLHHLSSHVSIINPTT
jgi:hypothetical protein